MSVVKDPYRYFRVEAQELVIALGEGLLALEQGPSVEVAGRLLRQAHTLKGAARVVKQPEIGELAHRIEDVLSPHRDGTAPVERVSIDAALAALDAIRVLLASLGGPTPRPAAAAQQGGAPRPSSAPVESEEQAPAVGIGALTEVAALLEGIEEAAAAVARARRDGAALPDVVRQARELATLARPGAAGGSVLVAPLERLAERLEGAQRSMRAALDVAGDRLEALRQEAAALRLVPARGMLGHLERATRDAAQGLERAVVFRAVGADTRLDAQVLSRLRTALLHLVRNAVAHGIEPEGDRIAAGKARVGTVEVEVARLGQRVLVTCRDDGRGLDVDAVRRVAVSHGVASHEDVAKLGVTELAELLLRGGISTSAAITQLSGRGVGLDAVRQAVEELGGRIAFSSEPTCGTTVALTVPVSLSWVPALAVEVADGLAYIPVESVKGAFTTSAGEVTRVPEGDRIVVDGVSVPFMTLRHALGRPASGIGATVHTTIVVAAGGQEAAFAVDGLRGVHDVVVRRLPERAQIAPVVAGATLDSDGVSQLVLSPAALVALAAVHTPPPALAAKARPLPLLVIDDSLTTRMLEQTILESAGYEVDLAVSGEEALDRARARRYGLFLVDVEMPGMSGFDFIAATRADAELRDVPSILVSSRAGAEDKQRGHAVGARAYIVKGEFDQRALLESIRRLVVQP